MGSRIQAHVDVLEVPGCVRDVISVVHQLLLAIETKLSSFRPIPIKPNTP